MNRISEKTPAQSVLIVIPVFNHASTLGQVLTDLLALSVPLLVVDDGSSDQIEDVLAEFPQVPRLRHAQNQGKGAALVTGMRYAQERAYAAILSFDADGQHLAADVPKLLQAYAQNPDKMIIGSRDFADAKSGDVTFSSRFGRQFSNFWIWVETGHWLPDTQTGLRIYPIDLDVLRAIRGRRYSFEIEIISRSIWLGRRVLSVPVQVYYPPRKERVSHFEPWLDNIRLSRTHTLLCTLAFLKLLGLYRPKRRSQREVRGARFSALLIAKLGSSFAYGLMIFPVLSSFLGRHHERASMLAFYARVRPHWTHTQKLKGAFRNFWYFGASIIDRLAMQDKQLVPSTLDNNNQVEGQFPPPGCILVGAHYGDWFLIARQAAHLSQSVLGLVLNPGVTPEFFEAMQKRSNNHLRILSAQGDRLGFVLAVKEILDGGGRVCFLIDRVEGKGLFSTFLGATTLVSQTPFAIATRLQVPVHFVCACKEGPGASSPYKIHAHEIWNGQGKQLEQELANQTLRILEQRVREAPQHWFNFFPL